MGILSVSATVAASAGAASALLPAVAGERLVSGISWLSLLLAAMGLGSFTGAFITMNLGRVRAPGTLFLLSAAVHGLAIAPFAVSAEPAAALFVLYVHGLAGTAVAGIAHSMLQAPTADVYRGRVMSVWGLQFVGLQPVRQFGLGVRGSLLGVHAALVAGGVVALAAGAYGAARLPIVRDWRYATADTAPDLSGTPGMGAAR